MTLLHENKIDFDGDNVQLEIITLKLTQLKHNENADLEQI